MMLDSTDIAILRTLDEVAGIGTGEVSKRARLSYGGTPRMRSGAIRSWLMRLKERGLVRYLDDQKPVCWCRTPEGTKALEGWNK